MRAILLAILLFSIGAHADVFDSYNQAYQKAMNQLLGQASADAAAQQRAWAQENAAAQALQARQAQETQDLSDAENEITTLQANQKALQVRVENPLQDNSRKNKKENKSDQKQLEQVTQELAIQKGRVTAMQGDLKQMTTQIATESQKLQSAAKTSQAAAEKFQSLSTDQQVRLQQATTQANSVFTQEKMNGFQAKLLLSDLNELQTEGKLSSAEVQALKNTSDSQLNGTLMGQYVNTQIEKAVAATCSPEFATSCSTQNMANVASYLNQKLNAPAASGSQFNDEAVKPASTGPGGAGIPSDANTVH